MRFFAPGKLFLFGEYGVLACGESIVAATQRGVWVNHDPAQRGYRVVDHRGELESAELALPEAVAKIGGVSDAMLGTLTADVSAMFHGGEKLGLGSSAASTAALVEAMASLSGAQHSAYERFLWAFKAHRRLQGGRGSGADVASSIYGGVISYRLTQPQAPFPALRGFEDTADIEDDDQPALITALSWPKGLRVEAIWLGKPASSTALIGRIERGLELQPDAMIGVLSQADAIASRARQCFEQGDVESILGCVRAADACMSLLGAQVGAPIIVDGHRRLRERLAQTGLYTKPSGAGGGDFSLIFGPRGAKAWDEVLMSLPEGCRWVPLEFGVQGAHRED